MNEMTINQKLVSVCVLMPFIADQLEDLLNNTNLRKDIFSKDMVNNARTLMKKFRKSDNILIGSADLESINQQSLLYIELKKFLIENIKITEDESKK